MNKKHKNPENGDAISAWFPGSLIAHIDETVALTGQKRSFVVAMSTLYGLARFRRKYGGDRQLLPRSSTKIEPTIVID